MSKTINPAFFQADFQFWKDALEKSHEAKGFIPKLLAVLKYGDAYLNGMPVDSAIPLVWYISHGLDILFDLSDLTPQQAEIFYRYLQLDEAKKRGAAINSFSARLQTIAMHDNKQRLHVVKHQRAFLGQSYTEREHRLNNNISFSWSDLIENKAFYLQVHASSRPSVDNKAYQKEFLQALGYPPATVKSNALNVKVTPKVLERLLQMPYGLVQAEEWQIAPLHHTPVSEIERAGMHLTEEADRYQRQIAELEGEKVKIEIEKLALQDMPIGAFNLRKFQDAVKQFLDQAHWNARYTTQLSADGTGDDIIAHVKDSQVIFGSDYIEINNLTSDVEAKILATLMEMLQQITKDRGLQVNIVDASPSMRAKIEKMLAEKKIPYVQPKKKDELTTKDNTQEEIKEVELVVEEDVPSSIEEIKEEDEPIKLTEEKLEVEKEDSDKIETWKKFELTAENLIVLRKNKYLERAHSIKQAALLWMHYTDAELPKEQLTSFNIKLSRLLTDLEAQVELSISNDQTVLYDLFSQYLGSVIMLMQSASGKHPRDIQDELKLAEGLALWERPTPEWYYKNQIQLSEKKSITYELLEQPLTALNNETIKAEWNVNNLASKKWFQKLPPFVQNYLRTVAKDSNLKNKSSFSSLLKNLPGISNGWTHTLKIDGKEACQFYRTSSAGPYQIKDEAEEFRIATQNYRRIFVDTFSTTKQAFLAKWKLQENDLSGFRLPGVAITVLSPAMHEHLPIKAIRHHGSNNRSLLRAKDHAIKQINDLYTSEDINTKKIIPEDENENAQFVELEDMGVNQNEDAPIKLQILRSNHIINKWRSGVQSWLTTENEEVKNNRQNSLIYIETILKILPSKETMKERNHVEQLNINVVKELLEGTSKAFGSANNYFLEIQITIDLMRHHIFNLYDYWKKNPTALWQDKNTANDFLIALDALTQYLYLNNDIKAPVDGPRNKHLHCAALEIILMSKLGLTAHVTCKSGKDRTGTVEVYVDAMLIYQARYGELPKYDALIEKREKFVNIFVELFLSGYQHNLANQNAPGCFGIKSLKGMLPEDVIGAILTQIHGEEFLEDTRVLADLNHLPDVISDLNKQQRAKARLTFKQAASTPLEIINPVVADIVFKSRTNINEESICALNEHLIGSKKQDDQTFLQTWFKKQGIKLQKEDLQKAITYNQLIRQGECTDPNVTANYSRFSQSYMKQPKNLKFFSEKIKGVEIPVVSLEEQLSDDNNVSQEKQEETPLILSKKSSNPNDES